MQVVLPLMDDIAILNAEYPYHAGAIAMYTAKTNEAKEIRQMKVFGCRHCRPRSTELANVPPPRKGDDGWRKRFTFDGLVSHVKEKCDRESIFPWTCAKRALRHPRHNIFPLGDEDFFRDVRAVADGGGELNVEPPGGE
jgi:hypothetical protein